MIDLAEIKKNNRLADMMSIYARRKKKQEAGLMIDKKRNIGTCECCKREDVYVKKGHGIQVCSMCSTVQARIKKFPVEMMAEFSRLVGPGFFPKPDESDLIATNKDLIGELDVLTSRNIELFNKSEALENENEALCLQVHHLQDDNLELIGDGPTLEVKVGSADCIPVSRLLADDRLLGAVNVLAESLREGQAV